MSKETQGQTPSVKTRESEHTPLALIDRFFDENFIDPFSVFAPSLIGRRAMSSFPKIDVTETGNEIKVTANVPGIDPAQIDIEVGEDYLSLSGKIDREEKTSDKGKVYRYEREYGEFHREFTLPARVNKDGIVAKSKNGVLIITMPKLEDERKTKIKVKAE